MLFIASCISAHGELNITFTPLDYPSAITTVPFGVSGNTIVGSYRDASGDHGFIYTGSFSKLDYTQDGISYPTVPQGINGSTIVGAFFDGTLYHGFIYDITAGTFDMPFDYPGAVGGTSINAVSGGSVVGTYSDGTEHGFYWDGTSAPVEIDYQLATDTFLFGILGSKIAGSYLYNGSYHGLYIDGKGFQTLDYDSNFNNSLTGISGKYTLGYYCDATFTHCTGFLYDGQFTIFGYPSAQSTVPLSLSGNTIVGVHSDGIGPEHGFIATIKQNHPKPKPHRS